MQDYMQELLELELELRSKQAKLALLKLKAKQELQTRGIKEQSLDGLGSISLAKKPGRQSKQSRAGQLVEQLELERNELKEINAEELYRIQTAIGKLELEEANLLNNEWTKELEAKIANERASAPATAQLTIKVKLRKPEPKPPAGFYQLVNELADELSTQGLQKLPAKAITELAMACSGEPKWAELVKLRFDMHKAYWTSLE